MKKLLKNCALCLTTIFLTCSPACCQTIEDKTPASDALRVLPGWTAPAKGYYLTDAAMRDTIAGWTTAKQQADIREQALIALRDEVKAQQADLKHQLAELQTEITMERKLWRSRIRRGKIQGLAWGILAGFAGGYLVKRNNP